MNKIQMPLLPLKFYIILKVQENITKKKENKWLLEWKLSVTKIYNIIYLRNPKISIEKPFKWMRSQKIKSLMYKMIINFLKLRIIS